ncbi:MAG TPA: FAD-dependent oxidoreductase [Gammaproteobacteria bacterium]|nr:FAD-dependent oxidoreductase [Gammaproteobacteria bacterium]
MILHLADRDPATLLDTDVCVIGAGAAGLAIAHELLGSRNRVLVLESGDSARSEECDALNEARSVGVPHSGAVDGRARVLGGATTAWGGQLIPLRESETRARPWVPGSGWPFGPETLEPYYRRVERLLAVEGPPYDERTWHRLGVAPPPLDRDRFVYRFSQWAPLSRRNLALLTRGAIAKSRNVDVLLRATATDLASSADGRHVDHVAAKDAAGRAFRVVARVYVVCCGGIETPRLLLASRSARGIANSSGTVGRYFQDHISLVAAEIPSTSRAAIRRYFAPRYRRGTMYTCKIEPADRTLAAHELLNVMAHVKFEIADALGLLEVKRMLRNVQEGRLPVPSLRSAAALARGSVELARLAFARAVLSRRAAPSRGRLRLVVDVEQAPNKDSRILLGSETDRYGMPKAVVDWRLTGQEHDTLKRFTALLAADWSHAGLGTLELAGEPDFDARDVLGAARDIYHHMGAARMSDDPCNGVVNRDLRCHDVDNLYLASSAAFPAGGIANPTFTLLALALRLADHLERSLGGDVSGWESPAESRRARDEEATC